MATRDTAGRNHPSIPSCLSALILASLLLFFHSSLHSSAPPSAAFPCNYSAGSWIQTHPLPPRYSSSCSEIFKGWNCIAAGKPNARDLLRWRWQPSSCPLPPLDPLPFLRRHRNTNIGFVGDSLNRNMFVSLVCTLRRATAEVRKWRPAGADRGFTFLRYNLTVAYHRTNLLVRYSRWSASGDGGGLESLGYKDGYRVDVDVPEHTWAEAPVHDQKFASNSLSLQQIEAGSELSPAKIHVRLEWNAPSKFDPIKSPMLFFEKGRAVLPPVPPEHGMDMALKHMISYVEKRMGIRGKKFFRTQSPRHFEGGDWNEGGSCRRTQPLTSEQVEELFSLENKGTNMEERLVNQQLYKALKNSSFQILDISYMSEFRADAHPSTAGGKKHEDCMHWCLPGLTDSWNDLLVVNLENTQRNQI